MQLTIDRPKFVAAFQQVAPLCTSKAKPILGNVHLSLNGRGAILRATDMETSIETHVEGVSGLDDGALLLPADRVGFVLKESTAQEIQVSTAGNSLRVLSGRSKFDFPTADPAEFPSLPPADFSAGFHRARARQFGQAIKRLAPACDEDSARYALGGIFMEFNSGHIDLVATDGKRLAHEHAEATVEGSHAPDTQTIVPARALRSLQSLLDADGDCDIRATSNHFAIRAGETTLTTRLVEGRFPRWRDVLPSERGNFVRLPCGTLQAAIGQAAVVTSKESRAVDFHFANGTLVLTSKTELGESSVELPVVWDHKALTVTLDYRYVGDFLRGVPLSDSVELFATDSESATLWTWGNCEYVVMPLAREQ